MTALHQSVVDQVAPADAYLGLKENATAALVDVRTRAEWTFIGVPDIDATGKPLWLIEYAAFPAMNRNDRFVEQLNEASGGHLPEQLFFICRSGARSLAAAQMVADAADRAGTPVHCTNIAEGFEGDLDQQGHRGSINGWKVRGLPWRQS